MATIREQYLSRRSILDHASISDLSPRLVGLLDWMEATPVVKVILSELRKSGHCVDGWETADGFVPANQSLEKVALVGLNLIEACRKDPSLRHIAEQAGIRHHLHGSHPIEVIEEAPAYAALKSYITPFLDYVLVQLPSEPSLGARLSPSTPPAIADSLERFRRDYPDEKKVCFIMMRFGKTSAHDEIVRGIKETMSKHGLTALRADDKEYHEDLYYNILTYLYGCGFGVAVFERLEVQDFNPNVALEVGFMLALRKPLLLLKDKTVTSLHADLVGKLYKLFDPQRVVETIKPEIECWLDDKGLA